LPVCSHTHGIHPPPTHAHALVVERPIFSPTGVTRRVASERARCLHVASLCPQPRVHPGRALPHAHFQRLFPPGKSFNNSSFLTPRTYAPYLYLCTIILRPFPTRQNNLSTLFLTSPPVHVPHISDPILAMYPAPVFPQISHSHIPHIVSHPPPVSATCLTPLPPPGTCRMSHPVFAIVS